MQLYQGRSVERIGTPTTTVRLRRPIGDGIELTGDYLFSHADLSGRESSLRDPSSVTDPSTARHDDRSRATVDTHVADLAIAARLNDTTTLHGAYRYDGRAQRGDVTERNEFGVLETATGYLLKANTVSGDVEWRPRSNLSLRGGMRFVQQGANFSQAVRKVGTTTYGAIADARWSPWQPLDLFARYEHAQVDDPLVAAGGFVNGVTIPEREIALTFTNRGRAGFRWRPRANVTLQYQLLADSRENATFAARTESLGHSVGVSWAPLETLTFFGGYTRRDLAQNADVRFPPTYGITLSSQSGSEDVITSELRWDFGALGQRFTTGWTFSWVKVDEALRPRLEPDGGARTPWALDRTYAMALLEWHHPWMEPSIEAGVADYGEPQRPRNDYRATIVTFKVTKRFTFGGS